MMTSECFTVTRTIQAPPTAIFAILADPTRHSDTEPTDWVRDAVDGEPLTGAGQIFAMNMYLEAAGGDYVTYNLVTEFAKDKVIAWMPGRMDDTGKHAGGGWFWRYELDPDGDRTDVTLTYDWTATPQEFRDHIGGMPPFPQEYLSASLAGLERSVTG